MIRAKPDSCAGCACEKHGTDFSQIEGTGANQVLIVAEASGEMEARDQLPLRPYAPAGSLLERSLRRMGMDRQSFSLTNVLRCRPRNNWLENSPWEYSAIAHCRSNLDAAIRARRPRAIVALGGVALRELTGMAGEQRGISHLAGYVLPSSHYMPIDTVMPTNVGVPIPVVGNFHPAFLRRGKASHQGIFARILRRATEIAAGRDREWMWNISPEDRSTHGNLRYNVHPSLDEARTFAGRVAENSQLPLSYDIETYESASLDEDAREGFTDTNVRLVQFSLGSCEGIALPWEGAYRDTIGGILRGPNVKCGHNCWLFDNKVLRAAGEREGLDLTPRGVIHDTLQMFHHWQPDLPAHLQFCSQFVSFPFPWKHLASTDIEFYGCCDVDATLRLYTFLRAALEKDGIWGNETLGYLGQVAAVRPVLAGMEDRGMPIDDSARLALDAEFTVAQEALGHELAARFPESECSVHPKCGYKRTPKDTDGMVVRTFDDAGVGPDGNPCVVKVDRYCRIEPFNPNSKDQVIRYMKYHGHKIPKSKEEDDEGNQKDTTAEKELRRLAVRTGDQFYLRVVEYRGFTKLRSTYIDGFVPGSDGCVHTTFTFAPAIGQLSSRNPNIQNFTKLKPTPELARAMRKMVAAKPGHILTEWDFKSCHIITLGFLAEDLNYMRLGRLDMHSFMAGHFLKHWDGFKIFSETDQELLKRFKWLKSDPDRKRVRDDQAKHGILGIGNGLRAKGLYERYLESFPSTPCISCMGTGKEAGVRGLRACRDCKGTKQQSGQRTAEAILEVAEALFPKVFAYQEAQRQEAHARQVLHTSFGYARRFYEVYRWDGKRGSWGHGDQAEEAVAYRLANIAFGHIREKLKELHHARLDEKYGLFNNVHDSFMFHFPEALLEDHIREVYPVLVRPSSVLRHPTICPDGLVIDVEGAYGKNWADMHEIDVHSRTTLKEPHDVRQPTTVQ